MEPRTPRQGYGASVFRLQQLPWLGGRGRPPSHQMVEMHTHYE
jgi:hypothetical protein